MIRDLGSILKVGMAQGLRDTLTRFWKSLKAEKMAASESLGGSIASEANLQFVRNKKINESFFVIICFYLL